MKVPSIPGWAKWFRALQELYSFTWKELFNSHPKIKIDSVPEVYQIHILHNGELIELLPYLCLEKLHCMQIQTNTSLHPGTNQWWLGNVFQTQELKREGKHSKWKVFSHISFLIHLFIALLGTESSTALYSTSEPHLQQSNYSKL